MEMDDESGSRLEAWIRAVERAGEHGFEEIEGLDALPEHARSESEFWCDEILTPLANPHDAPGARHRICRATDDIPDLIGHDLRAGDLSISVIEGRNFLWVRVDRGSLDLLAIPPLERPAAVARVAAALFKAPLDFGCDAIGEGSMLCTDPAVDPRHLSSWAGRAEGLIRRGELWFVCYKRCPSRLGFANACQWFSDDGSVKPPRRPAARRRARRP